MKIYQTIWLVIIFCFNTLFSAPIITNVSPYFGPIAGGTNVTIQGSGFTGATAVNFGNTPAASFTVNSDTSITATTPSHSPQVTLVTVATSSGTSPANEAASFVYQGNSVAYVSNANSNTVSVIDISSQTLIDTITVGSAPLGIAFTSDATKAYVANVDSGSVSIVDSATHTQTSTIPIGNSAVLVVTSPNDTKAFVNNDIQSTIGVIDEASDTLISIIATNEVNTRFLSLNTTATKLYASNVLSNSVSVVNTLDNSLLATITGFSQPGALVLTPDGSKLYVVNQQGNELTVVDTNSNTILSTITVGSNPISLAMTTDGAKLYVLNNNSNSVSVIDTVNDTVTSTISVDLAPQSVTILNDNSKVYVTNQTSNSVSVIDVATDSVIATVGVGANSLGIMQTPDDNYVYIANAGSNNVSVIETATDTLTNTISVGSNPIAIAMAPDQAPLARFVANLSPANSASTFDASASISPTGTIADYFWDFGDGTTINSLTPIVFHTYTNPGVYVVALTVTNTAGTSTQQLLLISSNLSKGDPTVIQQGGPSATVTQFINIPSAPAPIITAISPNSGSTLGGTSVTIIGTGFTGATSVLFGATPATFVVNSDSSITAISPAGTGTVDIRVITSGGTSAITCADQFTYIGISPVPSITSINPNSGPASGGTNVNIVGTGFTGATSVLFGAIPATFIVNSDTSITAISPAGIGTVDVRVVTAGGISAITPSDQFTYIGISPVPSITSINPNTGSIFGGTSVSIIGTGFIGTSSVLFGTTPATFVVNSDTSIIAISPAGTGVVDVRVVTAGGTSTVTAVDQFTYISSALPQPPRAVQGKQNKNVFATQTELVNKIFWKAPRSGSVPVAYHIYRDAALTELIAVIPANQNKLHFKEYGVKKHHNYSYFITTVDQAGLESSSTLIVISS